ncbi:hypothetical protein Leryth_019364 [Lithospermum erythrorhizon]|nr:hypothetical protein Leryth_019364 [Lithospermum erythrorhizon]
MEAEKKSSVSDVGAWGMNVVSSVGIIMANKQLMSSTGFAFTFATTLTGFHFTVTALVGMVSNATGLSASKHIPLWELLWFSIVANMSITGMNLSLMLNSVGFYQISKLSMIPVVCIMEWILHNKRYSKEVKMAVVVVVIGVGVCTVTDVKINAKGFICACVAVLCTSLQQISIAFSHPPKIYTLSFHVFCNEVNTSNILQATSFQVLGHMKTVCVLVLGWLLFDSALTLKNILGMFCCNLYVDLQSNGTEQPTSKTQPTEEEIRLLKRQPIETLSR